MSWKISVADYIPSFSIAARRLTTVDSTYTAGATIYFADAEDSYYFQQNDIFKIGPSTHSNNVGAIDYLMIKTITKDTGRSIVTLDAVSVYDFNAGDPIEGIGNSLPAGWYWDSGAAGDSVFTFRGTAARWGAAGGVLTGLGGESSSFWYTKAVGSTSYNYINYFADNTLLAGITYRLGIYYNNPAYSGGLYVLNLNESSSTSSLATANLAFSTSSVWVKAEDTGTWLTGDFGRYILGFAWHYTSSITIGGLDCIYLTHASLTSGDSAGVYTIPKDPLSVSRADVDRSRLTSFAGGKKTYYNSLQVNTARGYRIVWENATATMIRELEIMQYWQDSGYMLMLESDLDDLGDRPIFGFMDYSLHMSHWDEDRLTLNMNFVGI
jgi:hypothetical protein